jgi:predicted Ser/Thr protein kinase
MSDQPSNSDPRSAPAEAPAQEPPDLGSVLRGHGASSDDVPTIISKIPPTQAYPAAGPGNSSINGSIRGRTLAHFELLEPIGVGGMAAVLRARDKQLDRFVALKILPPEMAADIENVKRFHQEARAAAKLDHENIARVYFCGEDQKLHFIAFEFVEGQNLRTLLERRGRLGVREAVHYLLQIAAGLAHASSRGVVHRDIKPSNIIITPSGRAKLVDMGLARSLAPHDNRQLTQSGVTLGTFDYISPEQALEPRDADVRSDIYSLGCTFYHMLTGQPPVPEGTAAKKLHHHQHVAPVDPRQLNPEIGDEVAVVLQRMMAKDPANRYQRAEHLVQHLLQIAQKLGGAEVPEGLLFVDAPLLNPPKKRPLLLGAVAATLLGAFVLAVALAPPAVNLIPPGKNLLAAGKDEVPAKTVVADAGKSSAPLPDEMKKQEVATVEELEKALALAEKQSLRIVLVDNIAVKDAGLHFGGDSARELIIESASAGKPHTLEFTRETEGEPSSGLWAGLTVEDGKVTFSNVKISVTGDPSGALVAGVVVKSGSVAFKRCVFVQPDRAGELPVVSLAIGGAGLLPGPSEHVPDVSIKECYFPAGHIAVLVKGRAIVKSSSCAFGPHTVLFQIGGQAKSERADVALRNVSAHSLAGAVFRLEDGADCRLSAEYSIFAAPPAFDSSERAEFIHQAGGTRLVTFRGQRNAYKGLAVYWLKPAPAGESVEEADFATFKSWIAPSGSDANSSELSVSPWKNGSTSPSSDPKSAFAVNDRLPQLRRLEPELKNSLIGLEFCTWDKVNQPVLLPPDAPTPSPTRPDEVIAKLRPNEHLVDPASTEKGVHKKIESAVSEAQFGDVILIRHNGFLAVEPTSLSEGRSVTIKPFNSNYHPILVLGKTTKDPAALFHLHLSEITFKDLEFLLRPEVDDRHLAVVSLGGNSTCKFDHCVVTLDCGSEFSRVRLDVVAMLDPRDMMKSAIETRPRADVTFQNCFVRGLGNLVDARSTRLFDVRVDSSLLCLAGSVLSLQASANDLTSPELPSTLVLNRTTAYFSDQPAFSIVTGKMGRGLPLTHVTATASIFAAAAVKPLIRVDGPENEIQLKKVLAWTGEKNALFGFDKILEQSSDTGAMVVFQTDEWRRFSNVDTATRIDRLPMPMGAAADKPMTFLTPKDFESDGEARPFGVLASQVPRPTFDASLRPPGD